MRLGVFTVLFGVEYAGAPEEVARVIDRFIPGPTADLPIRV